MRTTTRQSKRRIFESKRVFLAHTISTLSLLIACAAFAPGNSAQAADSKEDKPHATEETRPTRYVDIKKPVSVVIESSPSNWPDYSQITRPANSYQLAGSDDDQLCGQVLSLFNEPGVHKRGLWWVSTKNLLLWEHVTYYPDPLGDPQVLQYGLDHLEMDFDGDSNKEHAYRKLAPISSDLKHVFAIFDVDLMRNPSLLENYKADCQKEHKADPVIEKVSGTFLGAIAENREMVPDTFFTSYLLSPVTEAV